MTYLGPQKSGLVLGSLIGGWVVEPFAIGRAIVLVLVTAAISYFVGLVGAALWVGRGKIVGTDVRRDPVADRQPAGLPPAPA